MIYRISKIPMGYLFSGCFALTTIYESDDNCFSRSEKAFHENTTSLEIVSSVSSMVFVSCKIISIKSLVVAEIKNTKRKLKSLQKRTDW